jgi:hypothetical protein
MLVTAFGGHWTVIIHHLIIIYRIYRRRIYRRRTFLALAREEAYNDARATQVAPYACFFWIRV